MFLPESQQTSPQPVANGLPEPALRVLLPCLRDWLDTQRDEAMALALLRALVRESIRAEANSKDVSLREFDARELTAACDWPEQNDFEASASKVKNARMDIYLKGRTPNIEAFFKERGFQHALRLNKHSPGGRRRAQWFLEAYALEEEQPLTVQPVDQPVEPRCDIALQTVEYEYAAPGTVRASWWMKPLFGTGSFKIKSLRGLIFASTIIVPALCLAFLGALGYLFMFVHKPLTASHLAFAILAVLMGFWLWKSFRNGGWLLVDRIAPAGEFIVSWKEPPAQLESFRAGQERVIGLVRYTATCPECAAAIELRYGEGNERRRLFGCCVESPQEHMFTFDRVTRRGKRAR